MDNYIQEKKRFSKLGVILVLGSLIYLGVQWGYFAIVRNIPTVAQNFNLYFFCAMTITYVIAYPIFMLLFKSVPVVCVGEKKKMKVSHVLIAFLISYSGGYLCNLATNKITTTISQITGNDIENGVSLIMMYANPLLTFLFVVICAPIMEELIFRKMLIDRIAQYGDVVAAFLSGLIFGLFHGNISQFFYAFLLGVCFGYVYVKTRNIKYTIILHMLVNGVSWIGSVVLQYSGLNEITMKLDEISKTDASDSAILSVLWENAGGLFLILGYLLLIMIAIVAGLVLFFTRKDRIIISQGDVAIPKEARFKVMLANVGMIIYIVFWIVMIVLDLFDI